MNISGLGSYLIKWSNPTVEGLVNSKIVMAINFFTGFSALVAVGIMVYSGYLFITAAGDPDQIEKGQKGITAGIVGMIIVFLARMIVEFVLDKIIYQIG